MNSPGFQGWGSGVLAAAVAVMALGLSACGSVTMYAPGSVIPAATAYPGWVNPVNDLGFDASGNVYAELAGGWVEELTGDLRRQVARVDGKNGVVMAATSSAKIWLGRESVDPEPPFRAPSGFGHLLAAARDGAGNVYVCYDRSVKAGDEAIAEFGAAGHTVVKVWPVRGVTSLAAASDGTLYVSEYQFHTGGRVLVYRNGNAQPTLTAPTTGGEPGLMKVQTDRGGRLYVLVRGDGRSEVDLREMDVYEPGGATLIRRIPLTVSAMYMYVAPSGAIAIAGEPEVIELLAPRTFSEAGRIHTEDCLGGFDRWNRLFTYQCNAPF